MRQNDTQVIRIPCTIKDIQDYMSFRSEEANKLSITKVFSYLKSYYDNGAHNETEADYAQKSFNEFIKYRYYTSKVDDKSALQDDDNEYVADMSFLDLSDEYINMEDGDFSNIYAIGTNFTNCNLHCANFKGAILPLATFDKNIMAYTNFENAVISHTKVGEHYGAPLMDNAVAENLDGQFNEMPGLPSLPKIDIGNSLSYRVLQAIETAQHGYETVTGTVVNGVNTITTGAKGCLIGGLGGFTLTNVGLAFVAPTIGFPIAVNLSLAGAALGATECVGYYFGYNSSVINMVSNKINSFFYKAPKEKCFVIDTPKLSGEEADFANVMVIHPGSVDSKTLAWLVQHSETPVFKEDAKGVYGDWQVIPPMPALEDDAGWEIVDYPMPALAPELGQEDADWEMIDS